MISPASIAWLLLVFMGTSWSYMCVMISLLAGRVDLATTLWSWGLCNLVVAVPLSLHFRESPLGPAKLETRWRCQLFVLAAMEILTKVLTAAILTGSPIGDAASLWNLSVIFSMLIQAALLRRAPGVVQIGAVVVTLVGIVLIQKPSFIFAGYEVERIAARFPHRKYYYILALSEALPYALMFVLSEHLQLRGVHWSVFYLNNAVGLLVSAAATTLAAPSRHLAFLASLTAQEAVEYLFVGVFDLLAHSCLFVAVQHIRSEVVAVFATLEIPFSYLLGFVFLGQRPEALGITGSTLIFGALITLSISKRIGEKEKEEENKKLMDGKE